MDRKSWRRRLVVGIIVALGLSLGAGGTVAGGHDFTHEEHHNHGHHHHP